MKTKTIINNYFLTVDSELFKTNVRKLLPEGVEVFDIHWVGMRKARGYGSYFYSLEASVNGESIELELHTNNSVDYDNYTDYEDGSRSLENWRKRVVLKILADEVVLSEIEELLNTQQND